MAALAHAATNPVPSATPKSVPLDPTRCHRMRSPLQELPRYPLAKAHRAQELPLEPLDSLVPVRPDDMAAHCATVILIEADDSMNSVISAPYRRLSGEKYSGPG